MFNTGLEYKATVDLARSQGACIIPPTISWVKSCEKHGYPLVSKNVSRRLHDIGNTPISTCVALFNDIYGLANKWLHLTNEQFVDFPISGYCCTEFKKKPAKQTKLNPIIGTRVEESNTRKSAWKKSGCNSYIYSKEGITGGVSRPISLWKDNDIEQYIEDEHVELSILYKQYEQKRTGCKICPYGCAIDGSRFDLLKELEPKTYDYYINHTKLGYILMITDTDIKTDEKYMQDKRQKWDEVLEWRRNNIEGDKLLQYKVNLSLKYHSKEELIKSLNHLYNKAPQAYSDYNDIIKLLKK